jgi:ATP-dependent DNA helicase PIF1
VILISSRTKARPALDLNPQFRRALEVMEGSSQSLFVTGRAGTGKSTLLEYFCRTTKKTVAVLAPTGVAALNVGGQTIHSFFGFRPAVTLGQIKKKRYSNQTDNVYTKLDAIVIDEISMVRADLLDCVDRFLRLNRPVADKPFGGLQMIFIGDLYQLPPVLTGREKEAFAALYETPYFYSARVFQDFDMELIELEKIYRQHDQGFIGLLNSIRNNSIDETGLRVLNERCQPEFKPPADRFYIYLTTTNDLADAVNREELSRLPGASYIHGGEISGDFGKEYLPTAVSLEINAGAQVMLLNNDYRGRWVNGSLGEITAITRDADGNPIIMVLLDNGETVDVAPYTWEIYRFAVKEGQLEAETAGSFTQFPLKLAWAVTIHKSQGKTFDNVIIDIGRGAFTPGQVYVALSRVTTLEGMVLKKPILKRHIWTDRRVMDFLTKYQYRKAATACPADDKIARIQEAMKEKANLRIVYLKPNDEKSERTIRPIRMGEMEYRGKAYLGLRAFCFTRNEERTFRVDRILEIGKPT